MSLENTTNEDPRNPAVYIFINGLALLCFYGAQDNGRAEIGFFDVTEPRTEHPLEISVIRLRDMKELPYPELKNQTFLRNSEIRINTGETGTGRCYQNYENPLDELDFRWLIDPIELHGRVPRSRARNTPTNSYFARLYINNGLFYSRRNTEYDTIKVVRRDDPAPTEQRFPHRRVSRIMGINIVSVAQSAPGVVFEVKRNNEERPIPFPLPKEEGPYVIYIQYKCGEKKLRSENRQQEDRGDFDAIYQVLHFEDDDRQFDIEFRPEEMPISKEILLNTLKLELEGLNRTEQEETNDSYISSEERIIKNSEAQSEEISVDTDKGTMSCELACQAIYLGAYTPLP